MAEYPEILPKPLNGGPYFPKQSFYDWLRNEYIPRLIYEPIRSPPPYTPSRRIVPTNLIEGHRRRVTMDRTMRGDNGEDYVITPDMDINEIEELLLRNGLRNIENHIHRITDAYKGVNHYYEVLFPDSHARQRFITHDGVSRQPDVDTRTILESAKEIYMRYKAVIQGWYNILSDIETERNIVGKRKPKRTRKRRHRKH